jgi:hypothetical protein
MQGANLSFQSLLVRSFSTFKRIILDESKNMTCAAVELFQFSFSSVPSVVRPIIVTYDTPTLTSNSPSYANYNYWSTSASDHRNIYCHDTERLRRWHDKSVRFCEFSLFEDLRSNGERIYNIK